MPTSPIAAGVSNKRGLAHMPDQVALVIGPTGATGGPIAAALARRLGWRVYGMSRTAPSGEAPFTHIAADLTDPGSAAAHWRPSNR